MSTSPSAPFDLPAAWSGLVRFLRTLTDQFGQAQALAHVRLPAWARRELAAWLDAAESLLRRLLLIEAQSLPPPKTARRLPPRALPAPAPAAQPEAALPCSDFTEPRLPDRVTFRLSPPPLYIVLHEHPVARARSRPGNPTFALARRLRAIAGVFEDPALYIRRMAAALARMRSLDVRIQTARLDPDLIPNPLRKSIYDAAWRAPDRDTS